jgi:hypothetical protein
MATAAFGGVAKAELLASEDDGIPLVEQHIYDLLKT